MKNKKLHMIGNAHIDPVWLWQWQEGYQEVKTTFRSALDRMKEYDDFVFVASSAAFYEWVEKSDPEMFAEIQQRVKEGRWGIVGGWWVEPDCNIPAGESFARHSLYGQRYFKEKFGVIAATGFNIDSFGHAATLPQILAKSGITNYTFLRPGPHEMKLPARLFWWQAVDGSRVMAFEIPFTYCTWGKGLEEHAARCVGEMHDPIDEFMCFYGVGDHGGGPTIENIESIHRMDADPNFPAALVCSTPDRFFNVARQKGWQLPVVDTELQHHASGCYAAHSSIKRWNRLAENRLMMAEKWCAMAAWLNFIPYPQDFGHAWKNVLFNQFHDIMAGTSLEDAYEDARDTFGEALAIAGRNLNSAVQTIAWNIKIPQQEHTRPLVVFNPCTWQTKTNIELESNPIEAGMTLLDELGKPIPYQTVRSATKTDRVRLTFTPDLPALGYRTFRLAPATPEAVNQPPAPGITVSATDTTLENKRFRLEFNAKTGYIISLRDKVNEVEVFQGNAALPVVIEDTSDTWSHGVFQFQKEIGKFTAKEIRLIEHGPVKSVIRVISEYGKSQLIQEFTMVPDLDPIEVAVTLDWREQHKMLKLRFPVNVKDLTVTSEIAYGTVERIPNGDEEPFQSWVDVSGIAAEKDLPYGFSLLNDGKYSLDVRGSDIGMTIVRSPVYAHHVPAELPSGEVYNFMDQGIQRFRYSLLAHTGTWETAGTVRRAVELNQRPIAFFTAFRPNGSLPPINTFIRVAPENIIVSVLKKAEDSADMILRAYNPSKQAVDAQIRLPNRGMFEARFLPGEIKTLRVPCDPTQPVYETNILEWD